MNIGFCYVMLQNDLRLSVIQRMRRATTATVSNLDQRISLGPLFCNKHVWVGEIGLHRNPKLSANALVLIHSSVYMPTHHQAAAAITIHYHKTTICSYSCTCILHLVIYVYRNACMVWPCSHIIIIVKPS